MTMAATAAELAEAKPRGEESAKAEFDAYLRQLAVKARDKEKWGAAHSKKARGELSGHWMTPRETLDHAATILDRLKLPALSLDVAASPGSTVCPDWFGPFHFERTKRDALDPALTWTAEGSAWCNPPYDQIRKFADRCALAPIPTFLLSYARTDTAWFHDVAVRHSALGWFRKGRITFVDPVTGRPGSVAPAPSALFLFHPNPDAKRKLRDIAEAAVGRVGPWRLARFAP